MADNYADYGRGLTLACTSPVDFNMQITDITSNETVETYDSTHTLSPDNYKEYILGWQDGGTFTVNGHFDYSDASFLDELLGVETEWTLTKVIGTNTDDIASFTGMVTSKDVSMPNQGVGTCSLQIKVTGAITWGS